jgi:asparagine synthetase B (glutamine-hydrolysing)
MGVRVTIGVDGDAAVVDVSRSINTSNEVYVVLEGLDAGLVITDHFLTALRHCSAAQRTTSADALIDHYLYRNVSGETTYAQGILRVGHGRTMRWRPTALKLQRVRQESLERPPTLAFADAVDLLEQSLLGVITGVARSAPAGAVTNLFSGGIDSTLIQVLLPKGSRCVSFGFDTPEFAPEVDRARAAARLTASEHHIIPLREEDYLGALERFLATVGLPPHHLQSVALAELFRQIE